MSPTSPTVPSTGETGTESPGAIGRVPGFKRRVKNSVRLGAARSRSASSGVCWSASSPSLCMVGLSSARNVGSRWKPAAIALRWGAEIAAVRPVSVIQRATSFLRWSSAATTVSEFLMKSWMIFDWLPRIWSTLRVSWSPGCARLRTSAKSAGRPARPVPSSAMISRSRSRYGRRRTLFTRSVGIVDCVWVTGTVPLSSWGELPGWQST